MILHENRLLVCQQTILMIYHALFVGKILNCRLLQIIGGALRVKGPGLNPEVIQQDQSVCVLQRSSHRIKWIANILK